MPRGLGLNFLSFLGSIRPWANCFASETLSILRGTHLSSWLKSSTVQWSALLKDTSAMVAARISNPHSDNSAIRTLWCARPLSHSAPYRPCNMFTFGGVLESIGMISLHLEDWGCVYASRPRELGLITLLWHMCAVHVVCIPMVVVIVLALLLKDFGGLRLCVCKWA